jgi:hypothetical protein
MTMIEFLFVLIGITISFSVLRVSKSIFNDLINKKYAVEDERIKEERAIAGEDTSEVALDYLKKL